jgi:hypothetical protein
MSWSFLEKTVFVTGDASKKDDGGNPAPDTTSTAFTADEKNTILAAMQAAYDRSSVARTMFENWVAKGGVFTVSHVTNDFYAYAGTGNIYLDLNYIKGLSYIDDHGNAVEHTAADAIIHELGHALTGKTDDDVDISASYFTGANVDFINTIWSPLGFPKEISYVAQSWNEGEAHPPGTDALHRTGYAYTNGAAINGAVTADVTFDPATRSGAIVTHDTNDLLIGGRSNNAFQSGGGSDFLIGAGGDDFLDGEGGKDTAVYFDANPADYDIRTTDNGATWTIRHVRGDGEDASKSDGTDKVQNVEVLQFDQKQHFDLKKGGLTFETDFAFVIDTTGSMGSSIGAVKARANEIIDKLFVDGKKDAEIAVVGFKDVTNGEPSSIILPFTEQDKFADRKAAAIAAINSITVGGGGDIPETDNNGLLLALTGLNWRVGAGKHDIVLFTDAPVKDTALTSTVASLAHNLGATITSHVSEAGSGGVVDTFGFALPASDAEAAHIALPTDGHPLPTFTLHDSTATPDPTNATLQVFTIFTGPDGTDTSGLTDIASQTGGKFFTAADSATLVDTILSIIDLPPPGSHTPYDHGHLIQNPNTGEIDYLHMDSFNLKESFEPAVKLWPIVAEGDFNNDTNWDLVTQNDGQIDFVFTDGHDVVSSMLVKGTYWNVKDAGTFDGGPAGPSLVTQDKSSGQIDLLHFDTNGNLDQSALLEGKYWKVVAAGDFNNDGRTDIVTQSDDGQIDILSFQGTKLVGSNLLEGKYWDVKGANDFDQDGHPDLVTQDKETGRVNNLTFTGSQLTASLMENTAYPGWEVAHANHAAEQFWHI